MYSLCLFVDKGDTCSHGDCKADPADEEVAARYQKPTERANALKPCPSPPPSLGENTGASPRKIYKMQNFLPTLQ